MTGLLLRLAGPLQSWGERSPFAAVRDSAAFPTRSGLIGMFAAAEGRTRDQDLHPYADLEFTTRIDRPGLRLIDYHTVGGGLPDHLTAATSGGKHKGDAVITRRHYLADAVFVVAVTGPAQTIARIAKALHQPHWAPYLGRRSCIPDEPLLLRANTDDPIAELRHRVPLSPRNPNPPGQSRGDTIPVEFLWEKPPASPSPGDVEVTVHDSPTSFAQHHRSHGKRRIYRTTEHLPASLSAAPTTLHTQLINYVQQVPA
ncbi:type I-E CRISPR-associated protein Cas5/CasD [Streptomyces sp. NPDC058301]|uniref:type I-E CRISPR-associated protein Cas5/CasD n=1 Tax=Streptomyces sp. NPDC058301 TaxID=3346436 RepID=UPI0036E775E1